MNNERDSEIEALRRRLAELEALEADGAGPNPPVPQPAPARSKANRTALFGMVSVAVLLVASIAYCSSQPNRSSPLTSSDGTTRIQREIAASLADQPMAPVSLTRWTYRNAVDPMTDRTTHFACVTSTNQIRLNPPYDDVRAELCIRQSPRYGLDVYVQLLGNGQILCRSYNNCTVKVRFGDGAQQSFSATDATDGSSNVIFISNADRFTTGAKTADATRVQMTFYEAGDQVVEFSTKGLEWPRPKN